MISAAGNRELFRDLDVRLDPLEELPPDPPPPPVDPNTPPPPVWQPGDPLPWEQPIPGSTLFVEGAPGDEDAGVAIHFNDIKQGPVQPTGDCYFLATVAAIARRNPDEIKNMIRENRDASGKVTSYTVTLYAKESKWLGLSHDTVKREITVDANFHKWHRAQVGDMNGGRTEVWPLVLEEAYSKLNPDYGKGGWPQDAYFALTGRDASVHLPFDQPLPSFPRGGGGGVIRAPSFEDLARQLDQGKCIMLSTKKDGVGAGLVSNHVYMMNGYHLDSAGRKVLELYNPHGQKVDILFDDFKKYFRSVAIGG